MRLTAATRKHLPASDFAGPNRSYPMQDAAHARAAKAYASRYASPALRASIDAKVDARYGYGPKRRLRRRKQT